MAENPIWTERELPTMQLTDLGLGRAGHQDALHSLDNPDGNWDFTAWVNDFRHLVRSGTRDLEDDVIGDLMAIGVYPQAINAVVTELTGAPKFPLKLVQRNATIGHRSFYRQSIDALTPGFGFSDNEPIDGQYNPLLGVIILSDRHLQDTEPAGIAHTLAENFGQAATGSVISVQIEREPEPSFRFWYGYQWRHDGEMYGGAIQKASTEKLAALVRSELRLSASGEPEANQLLEPYRRADGYFYESGMAMTLDIINERLGYSQGQPGIYEPIWQFGQKGGDEAARDALADMVLHATDAQVSLEDLESVPVRNEGFPYEIMERVEEACGVEPSRRPSIVFQTRAED